MFTRVWFKLYLVTEQQFIEELRLTDMSGAPRPSNFNSSILQLFLLPAAISQLRRQIPVELKGGRVPEAESRCLKPTWPLAAVEWERWVGRSGLAEGKILLDVTENMILKLQDLTRTPLFGFSSAVFSYTWITVETAPVFGAQLACGRGYRFTPPIYFNTSA